MRGIHIQSSKLEKPSSYTLKCLNCDNAYYDEYQLACREDGCNGLLRTDYPKEQLTLTPNEGLFRFSNWLPVEGTLKTKAGPVTYHAKKLGEYIGLNNVFVSFNGYWPEKEAFTQSGSFKEYEAYPTLQRMRERKQGILQISSAGNTARAFANASAKIGEKVVLVVPTHALDRLWTTDPNHDHIFLIAVNGDYLDAITFGKSLVNHYENLLPEGGARNVARRDGMGLTMLDAAITVGKLPDYYFQGIGSGTGGIAAYEMALKLLADGSYGNVLPKFYLSQNAPFIPMVNAWNAGRREILAEDMPNAKEAIERIYAKLLSNREPPYTITGGVYDTLSGSNGKMIAVTNEEAKKAYNLFEEIEGIDIDPAAAVAFASLLQENQEGSLDEDDIILLNISGGGYNRVKEDQDTYSITPEITLDLESYTEIPSEVSLLLENFLD